MKIQPPTDTNWEKEKKNTEKDIPSTKNMKIQPPTDTNWEKEKN
jgi:hypothetical protein